jgi:hypothetical protein
VRLRSPGLLPGRPAPASRSLTALFGVLWKPLADARGSELSRDRKGAVSRKSTPSRGQSPSARMQPGLVGQIGMSTLRLGVVSDASGCTPRPDIGKTRFGAITSASNPRQIQMSVRFVF